MSKPHNSDRFLPSAYRNKLAKISQDLENGLKFYWEYGGKQLHVCPSIISVPLGRRYRALFTQTPHGLRFKTCLTHEKYNNMDFLP